MTDAGERYVNPWVIAIAVMAATFMEVLDTTVVNVALPHIAGSLSASVNEATWALTSYLVANAIILPLTGWLASLIGRKRLIMVAIGGFTVASFLCGLAPTLSALVVFRVIQGATGGVLQPVSQAVLLEAFPPEQRGRAMAFWLLGIVVAPILGPVLGGWLTDNYSWRWIFYINLPVGVFALTMVRLYIFDPSYIRDAGRRVDYWGIGLLAVGIGALQFLLDKGQEADWFASDLMAALLVVSVVALAALIIRELRAAEPVMDLRVFKERSYATGLFLMTMLGFVLYGSLVILPIMLQTLLGYSAMEAGIAMAPRGIGAFLMMPLVGFLTERFDPRKLLTLGFIVGGATLIWLGQINMEAGYWNFFWPQFVQGTGMSLLFVPLTTVTMQNIAREKMGNATSLFNLMRNLGGSIGIAVTGTILERRTREIATTMGAHLSAYDPATNARLAQLQSNFIANGSDPVTAMMRAQASLHGMLLQQSSMVTFVQIFEGMGLIFILLVPLVLLLSRPKRGAAPRPMAH